MIFYLQNLILLGLATKRPTPKTPKPLNPKPFWVFRGHGHSNAGTLFTYTAHKQTSMVTTACSMYTTKWPVENLRKVYTPQGAYTSLARTTWLRECIGLTRQSTLPQIGVQRLQFLGRLSDQYTRDKVYLLHNPTEKTYPALIHIYNGASH